MPLGKSLSTSYSTTTVIREILSSLLKVIHLERDSPGPVSTGYPGYRAVALFDNFP